MDLFVSISIRSIMFHLVSVRIKSHESIIIKRTVPCECWGCITEKNKYDENMSSKPDAIWSHFGETIFIQSLFHRHTVIAELVWSSYIVYSMSIGILHFARHSNKEKRRKISATEAMALKCIKLKSDILVMWMDPSPHARHTIEQMLRS